jgi:steroid 5-alpha reductase family enzyme
MGSITTYASILGLLSGLTLLITALGFRRLVYFVSIGYGFAIAGMALVTAWIFRQHLPVLALVQDLLLLGWGLRLGGFLAWREMRPSYQKQAREVNRQYARVGTAQKAAIWLGVSILYVLMFLPGLYDSAGTARPLSGAGQAVQAAGLLLMAAGLILEALSDRQKSVFKAGSPQAFCDVGLYRLVRCPNYLGEIVFWSGNWVLGMPFYTTPLRWIASLAGLVCLILIMLGSTRRLERAQEQRYGSQPEYQSYVRRVPVLFPFVPLYTLKNVRVYLE